MADLSLVVTRRWGPAVIGLGYQSLDSTGLDLSTISDSDSMFIVVAHCLSFRVASTTAYAEYVERRAMVTRVSGTYTLSPFVAGLPSGDNDYGPSMYAQAVGGVHTAISPQVDFVFSLSSSTLRITASRIASGANVSCRAYLKIRVGDV